MGGFSSACTLLSHDSSSSNRSDRFKTIPPVFVLQTRSQVTVGLFSTFESVAEKCFRHLGDSFPNPGRDEALQQVAFISFGLTHFDERVSRDSASTAGTEIRAARSLHRIPGAHGGWRRGVCHPCNLQGVMDMEEQSQNLLCRQTRAFFKGNPAPNLLKNIQS